MPISPLEGRMLQERTERNRKPKQQMYGNIPMVPVERESDLHDDIERWLRQRSWYYVHSRMDKPATNQLGTPDFIVAAPKGVTLWIEAKRKDGKLTQHQLGAKLMLKQLGHHHAVVYTFDQFLNIVNGKDL